MTSEDALLWRRARAGFARNEPPADELDPLLLAAYLDGRLGAAEGALVEQRLAGDPAALELFMAARDALDAPPPDSVPASLAARAQGLVRAVPKAEAGKAGRLGRLFADWGLVPNSAAWAAFAMALFLSSLAGFELGQVSTPILTGPTTVAAQGADDGLDDVTELLL